jgi:hypothetical protein
MKIHITVILPTVLYRCETWSLALREEQRLWVYENRVLRRVFGPKKDEVTQGWRRLHKEELHNLYSSLNISKIIRSKRIRGMGHIPPTGR